MAYVRYYFSVQGSIKSVHTLISYFIKIHFNITLTWRRGKVPRIINISGIVILQLQPLPACISNMCTKSVTMHDFPILALIA
jgi:hypothetical protein